MSGERVDQSRRGGDRRENTRCTDGVRDGESVRLLVATIRRPRPSNSRHSIPLRIAELGLSGPRDGLSVLAKDGKENRDYAHRFTHFSFVLRAIVSNAILEFECGNSICESSRAQSAEVFNDDSREMPIPLPIQNPM